MTTEAAPSTTSGFTVGELKNLGKTLQELERFAPDLAEKLNQVMKDAMQEVSDTAKAGFPTGPGRWGGHGSAGFKVIKSRSTIGYTAVNAKKSAVIIEFAGKVNPSGLKTRGTSLIATLNQKYGRAGRFLWSAWETLGEHEVHKVLAAAEELQAEYTARFAIAPGVI